MYTIPLYRHLFSESKVTILSSQGFTVTAFCYPHNIASLIIENSRGYIEVLPYYGQMIWDANFDGISLRMGNPFTVPKFGSEIIDTYGCFAFHSGLLSGGCPASEDTHALHGEFSCAQMDSAWLVIDGNSIRIVSEYEYIKGFGYHYCARPSATLRAHESRFDIDMTVINRSKHQAMPLMYMCHMNYAYVDDGVMSENIPAHAWKLRDSVPAHVNPTKEWQAFNEDIKQGKIDATVLEKAHLYDPEIVHFADDLSQYGDTIECNFYNPSDDVTFSSVFSSSEFSHATRWILKNPDQQVAAFCLPATARPEGYNAAEEAGTLRWLQVGESQNFHINTGLKE